MFIDFLKKYKKELALVVIALFVGFVYYLPNIIINNYAGSSPDIVYKAAVSDLDEAFSYGAMIREVLDGNFWEGDLYLSEHKNMPSLWGTNLAALLFGLSFSLFGFNAINIIFSVSDFIFPAILFILVFYFFFSITKHRLFSILGSLVLLLFPNLFILRKIFSFSFYDRFFIKNLSELIMVGFNTGLSRIFVPGFYIIFFLLFLFFVLLSIKKDYKRLLLFSGLSFGLLFYFYFYYWAFAFIFLLFLFFALFFAKQKKQAFSILKIFILGLIISIPFWIKMLYLKTFPLYSTYSDRVGKEMGRFLRTESVDLYILIVVLFFIFLYFWRKKKDAIFLFLIALSITMPAVINLQIITGFNIQPDHWGSRVNVYILTLVFLVAIFYFIKNSKYRLYSRINTLSLIGIIFILIFSLISQIKDSGRKYDDFVLNSDFYDSLIWIDGNTKNGSVIVTPSIYTNHILSVLTHNNIYLPPACRSMASEGEIILRFLEVNRFFNVKRDYLKKSFNEEIFGMGYRQDDYGIYLFCETYNKMMYSGSAKTRMGELMAEELLSRFDGFIFDKFNYRADYIFYGPDEVLISNFDPGEAHGLELVFFNNSVKIYEISYKAVKL